MSDLNQEAFQFCKNMNLQNKEIIFSDKCKMMNEMTKDFEQEIFQTVWQNFENMT